MDDEKKLRTYLEMAEVTRKWVNIMDAKAAFISTLNAGLLTFIWSGAKLIGQTGFPLVFALLATVTSFISLGLALRTVLPKLSFSGNYKGQKAGFKSLSFFGYVAKNYPLDKKDMFFKDIEAMNEGDLAREALEQHFINSHTAQYKARLLLYGGMLFLLSLVFVILALTITYLA